MNGDLPKRDVKNHLLFEIATEVANRGLHYSKLYSFGDLTWYSWWYLLCVEVEGPCYDC